MLTYRDRIESRRQLFEEAEKIKGYVEEILSSLYPLYDFCDVLKGESYLVNVGKCETTYDILRFFYRETVKK